MLLLLLKSLKVQSFGPVGLLLSLLLLTGETEIISQLSLLLWPLVQMGNLLLLLLQIDQRRELLLLLIDGRSRQLLLLLLLLRTDESSQLLLL